MQEACQHAKIVPNKRRLGYIDRESRLWYIGDTGRISRPDKSWGLNMQESCQIWVAVDDCAILIFENEEALRAMEEEGSSILRLTEEEISRLPAEDDEAGWERAIGAWMDGHRPWEA